MGSGGLKTCDMLGECFVADRDAGTASSMKLATGGGDSEAGKTRRGACLGFSSQGNTAWTFLRSGTGAVTRFPSCSPEARPITCSY